MPAQGQQLIYQDGAIEMKFQGAVIKEQGVTFPLVVVLPKYYGKVYSKIGNYGRISMMPFSTN